MRHRRLVSGGVVYFHGISHAKGLAADGQNLLMFPIYGMGAILPEISGLVDWWLGGERLDWMDRVIRHGILYTVLIFMGEYLFGSILKAYGICPWDYTGLHSNVNGLIRLDFAPLWFATGLIFERITKKKEV